MLFKDFHVEMIVNGYKTQTRRRITRCKKGKRKGKVNPPLKVGSIQPCKTTMYGETFAKVKIFRRWAERLGDISAEDAKAEGEYTPEEYIKGVSEMYDNAIDENEVMWCYEFVRVLLCPECGGICDTYGQTWRCIPCDQEYGTIPTYVWYQATKAEEVLS